MEDERIHRLAVGADLDDVLRASEWLKQIAQAEGLPADLLFRIDLCLAEAITNVISYGLNETGSKRIDLELRIVADETTLSLEDSGVPFNPLSVPPPTQPAGLEDARIGGLGVHLMRSYADDCAYERRGARNRLTLRWLGPLPAAA